ncbi:MAG: sigma-70 family RNA polymerase sigma factor [Planctomycetales bacterium]|nr:sigma-70 family RNA polymerase sigma factor [Planctomycetales bacterium]
MQTFEDDTCSLSRVSTAELVLAAQSGDSEAFGQLVERFEKMVHSVCWKRLGNYDEVDEAAQDVFIKAYEKLGQLREPEAFPGWLRSIATRQALNRCTRSAKYVAVEPQTFESLDCGSVDPLDVVMLYETQGQLHQGLDRLEKMDRSTLEAFYFRGQSLLQMSDEFSAPVGTIKRRLHVARKRLAQELECLQAV